MSRAKPASAELSDGWVGRNCQAPSPYPTRRVSTARRATGSQRRTRSDRVFSMVAILDVRGGRATCRMALPLRDLLGRGVRVRARVDLLDVVQAGLGDAAGAAGASLLRGVLAQGL